MQNYYRQRRSSTAAHGTACHILPHLALYQSLAGARSPCQHVTSGTQTTTLPGACWIVCPEADVLGSTLCQTQHADGDKASRSFSVLQGLLTTVYTPQQSSTGTQPETGHRFADHLHFGRPCLACTSQRVDSFWSGSSLATEALTLHDTYSHRNHKYLPQSDTTVCYAQQHPACIRMQQHHPPTRSIQPQRQPRTQP